MVREILGIRGFLASVPEAGVGNLEQISDGSVSPNPRGLDTMSWQARDSTTKCIAVPRKVRVKIQGASMPSPRM